MQETKCPARIVEKQGAKFRYKFHFLAGEPEAFFRKVGPLEDDLLKSYSHNGNAMFAKKVLARGDGIGFQNLEAAMRKAEDILRVRSRLPSPALDFLCAVESPYSAYVIYGEERVPDSKELFDLRYTRRDLGAIPRNLGRMLAHLHSPEGGVVLMHGDLGRGCNVLISPDDELKIIDYVTARSRLPGERLHQEFIKDHQPGELFAAAGAFLRIMREDLEVQNLHEFFSAYFSSLKNPHLDFARITDMAHARSGECPQYLKALESI